MPRRLLWPIDGKGGAASAVPLSSKPGMDMALKRKVPKNSAIEDGLVQSMVGPAGLEPAT